MARKVLAAANNKEQKYFMEEEFIHEMLLPELRRVLDTVSDLPQES